MSRVLLLLVGTLLAICGTAQTDDFFVVDRLYFEGNDKTAERVIYNELDIAVGDTIYTRNLDRTLLENKKRLLSTALFTIVEMHVKNWRISEQRAEIQIIFQENWYIYPSVIFELADRNFNVWWTEQNRDFSRIDYGLSVDHINLTGNKDKLKVKLQRGFTHKYEISYEYPYISRYWGMSGELFYATNKELGFVTTENILRFRREDDERVLLRRFRTGVGVNYRPNVYVFQEAQLQYHRNTIDEVVAAEYNPEYFGEARTVQQYFRLSYGYRYDRRVFTLYPEGGYAVSIGTVKEGLTVFDDINTLSVDASYEKYHSVTNRWIVGGRVKGSTQLIRDAIPYANNQGLGYEEDLVRGYELYVLDGADWLLVKTSASYLLHSSIRQLGSYMPIQQLRKMPLKIYLRANIDTGYANEPTYIATNELNNRWVLGYGPAVDVVVWNVGLFSVEYSFNDLGEDNLFLSADFNF